MASNAQTSRSWIITEEQTWLGAKCPGEVLQQEFLVPLGISQYRLAKESSVPPRRINEIVRATRSISADTAQRGTSECFWMNLQARYDLELVTLAQTKAQP
jgi:addiction module HigA family antidote